MNMYGVQYRHTLSVMSGPRISTTACPHHQPVTHQQHLPPTSSLMSSLHHIKLHPTTFSSQNCLNSLENYATQNTHVTQKTPQPHSPLTARASHHWHFRVKSERCSSNTEYHNKLPHPKLWFLAKPQIFHFCRQDTFHSSQPSPQPFAAPLSFSISSLTNYPSPCVRNCMHNKELWIITDVLLDGHTLENCGCVLSPLLNMIYTWKCLHPVKNCFGVWATRGHRIESGMVGKKQLLSFFHTKNDGMMVKTKFPSDRIPRLACALHYKPPLNFFLPLFPLSLLTTWYALIHDHYDDKPEKFICVCLLHDYL